MFNDKDPKFFSPADKARIIEFVLKRERFDRERFSEEKGDPFAFGSIFFAIFILQIIRGVRANKIKYEAKMRNRNSSSLL